MSAAFVPPAMPHHLPRPLAALALIAALAAPPRSVDAQSVVSSVDIGGAGMKWGDSLTTTRTVAGSIAPAVRLDWARATLGASGSWSHLGPGWSSQGLLVGSVFTPSLGPLSLELAGNLAGSLHSDDTRAAQTLGLGRLHAMASRGGLWAGGGAGTVWDGVAGWSQLKVAEGGLWGRIGRLTALVSASPMWIEDAEPFTDGELAIRIPGDRYEFGAAVGARFGTIPPGVLDDTKQWGSASLLVRLPGRVSLVAAAGTYPADLAQRFPGGQFASLGLRLGGWPNQSSPTGDRDAWRTAVPDERTRAAEEMEARAGGMMAFEAQSGGAAGRTMLRVRAPSAHFVEVYGSFTNWQPVSLVRGRDGWWSVTLPVAQGTHEVNVRVDGGAWLVPPGTTTVRDEFGGAAGVLVVDW